MAKTDAAAQPVTADTLEQFREIYNQRMLHVPNAAYMSLRDMDKLLNDPVERAWFVFHGQQLMGIGITGESSIEAVAGVVPGAGRDVLLALAETVDKDEIFLVVADTNVPAMRLYRQLGFSVTETGASWYKIL